MTQPTDRSRGGLFPFPHWSTRTRGGTRVTVGGCCLPIGCLTMLVGSLGTAGAATAVARLARR